jgi:hypothetical protein
MRHARNAEVATDIDEHRRQVAYSGSRIFFGPCRMASSDANLLGKVG